MTGKQPRNIKWKVIFATYKQNYNPNRYFSEGLECILSENINRRPMNSSKVKVTNQSARTQIYKSGVINFSQYVLSESFQDSGEWLLSPKVYQMESQFWVPQR